MIVGGFDPGINRAGLVCWSTEHQQVVHAELFKLPTQIDKRKVKGDYAMTMMVRLLKGTQQPIVPELLVVETQHTHRHPRPQDLVRLATISGAAAACFPASEILFAQPGDWTGSISKDIHQNRTLRKAGVTREALADMVGCTLPHASELVDALGLALYGVKKL
jgi:hypothetical protein